MDAPAKINVCLFVGPTRAADGRHELVSVMQAVDLSDRLSLAPAEGDEDEVACPGVRGPNLVTHAIEAFRARTGWQGAPVRITIDKQIPVAAGMAGGSADAGAALRLLAEAAELHDDGLLREIASGLGADVPAQVRPGRWLATGAGERVEPLGDVPPYGVLVLPGDAELPTPLVYRQFDLLGLQRTQRDLDARLQEVRSLGADLPDHLVVNDLAPAAVSLDPSIATRLVAARRAGAHHALVSGSGPTVLGLFEDPAAAGHAAERLRDEHPRAVATQPVAA